MKTTVSRLSRGSSLIEVMFAAAILLLGLVGIVQLIIAGKGVTREPRVALNAMIMSSGALAELAGASYYDIDAGTFSGNITGPDGRKYPRTVQVVRVTDGGVPYYRITATTEWKDSFNRVRTTTATTFVSEPPDGGV